MQTLARITNKNFIL